MDCWVCGTARVEARFSIICSSFGSLENAQGFLFYTFIVFVSQLYEFDPIERIAWEWRVRFLRTIGRLCEKCNENTVWLGLVWLKSPWKHICSNRSVETTNSYQIPKDYAVEGFYKETFLTLLDRATEVCYLLCYHKAQLPRVLTKFALRLPRFFRRNP